MTPIHVDIEVEIGIITKPTFLKKTYTYKMFIKLQKKRCRKVFLYYLLQKKLDKYFY